MPDLLSTFAQRLRRRRAFSDLLALDDRLLHDIGLSRAEVTSRARKRRDHE